MTPQFSIAPPYRDGLAALGLTDFRRVMETVAGTPVGVHADRDVMRLRVQIDGAPRELYLKRTLRHAPAGLLREMVAGRWPTHRPVREYHLARQLDRLGIPANKAVGYGHAGRRLWPGAGFVILEAVPGRVSLYQAWQRDLEAAVQLSATHKRQLIRRVARLVARLHAAHLRWPDLLAKHILFNLPPPDPPAPDWILHLIDVERMQNDRSEKSRRRDLLAFLASMPPDTVSRTDLLRFAIAYGALENLSRVDRRAALARTFGWAAPTFTRRGRSRPRGQADDPLLARGRYIKFKGATLDDRYIDLFRTLGVASFKSVFKWRAPEPEPRPGWRQRDRFSLAAPGGDDVTFDLQRFDRPPLTAQWRRILRCRPSRSLAWWQWRWARRLVELGIPTAPPVAFGEKMQGPFEKRSFLLLRVPEGRRCDELLADRDVCPTGCARGQLLERCATVLAQLHEAGLAFRDGVAHHLMLTPGPNGELRPALVDLDNLSQPRHLRDAHRTADLADLLRAADGSTLTQADRHRFLRAYLDATPWRPPGCTPVAPPRHAARALGPLIPRRRRR